MGSLPATFFLGASGSRRGWWLKSAATVASKPRAGHHVVSI